MTTQNQNQMLPLTSKELDYIVDCISNESMLAKHAAATAASAQDKMVQQALMGFVQRHEQHLNELVGALEAHKGIARLSRSKELARVW